MKLQHEAKKTYGPRPRFFLVWALLLALGFHTALVFLARLLPHPETPKPKQIITVDVIRKPTPPNVPVTNPPISKPPVSPPVRVPPIPKPPRPQPLRKNPPPLPKDPWSMRPPRTSSSDAPKNPAPPPPGTPRVPEGPLSPGPKVPAFVLNPPGFSPYTGLPPLGTPIKPNPSSGPPGIPGVPGSEPEPAEYPLRPARGGGFVYEGKTYSAQILRDGRVTFENKGPIGFDKSRMAITFDVGDMISRGLGNDPYASSKRRFLEKTEALRKELHKKALLEREAQERAKMVGQLNRIWNSEKPLTSRHRAIFELWMDRGDEPPPSISAGAREEIEAFVRSELPKGSENEITAQELAEYNQELASQGFRVRFHPY